MGILKKVKSKDLYKLPNEEEACDDINIVSKDKIFELKNNLLSIFELE